MKSIQRITHFYCSINNWLPAKRSFCTRHLIKIIKTNIAQTELLEYTELCIAVYRKLKFATNLLFQKNREISRRLLIYILSVFTFVASKLPLPISFSFSTYNRTFIKRSSIVNGWVTAKHRFRRKGSLKGNYFFNSKYSDRRD